MKAQKHGYHLRATHRIEVSEYDDLKEFQGGKCAICQRATGKTHRLAVDHAHAIAREECGHVERQSCKTCHRGLLCLVCNRMLGHGRDDPDFFTRAARYLMDPPAQRFWQERDGQALDPGSAEPLRPGHLEAA